MPKPPKPAPIPDWLKVTLQRKTNGEPSPDTMDLQVVSAALAGVELEALKARFGIEPGEIQNSLLRVACAVRENRVDAKTFEEYPDLLALRPSRRRAKKDAKRPNSIADLEAMEVSTEGLPEIIPGDDKSLHDFLVAIKARSAETLIPATLNALQRNVNSYDGTVSNPAVSKSLEMYYGIGRRGPGVAMQFNLGDKSADKSVDTPHFFEETILAAEEADGSGGGETTVFDERLLGQQEE
jgi:hypothetical protein